MTRCRYCAAVIEHRRGLWWHVVTGRRSCRDLLGLMRRAEPA